MVVACVPGIPTGGAPAETPARLALVYGSEGNIVVAGADGKERTVLTKTPQGGLAKDPSWSPDGKTIAYAYTPPLPNTRGPGGLLPLPVTGVYTMNADGSDQKIAIPHTTPGIGHESPVWAPDGKSFYVTYTELIVESSIVRDQIVEVARVTPGAERRETLVPQGAFPTISPDGKLLACILTGRDGLSLVVAGANGQGQRTLVPAGMLEGLAAPRFSPDGKRIAFSAAAPMPPVPTVTPFRRAATPLESLLAPRTAHAAPRQHGLPMDIFVIPTEGGQARRLTLLGEDSPTVAWSPDGMRLAILAGGGVYSLTVDGSDLSSIDQKGGHGSIDWRSR